MFSVAVTGVDVNGMAGVFDGDGASAVNVAGVGIHSVGGVVAVVVCVVGGGCGVIAVWYGRKC